VEVVASLPMPVPLVPLVPTLPLAPSPWAPLWAWTWAHGLANSTDWQRTGG